MATLSRALAAAKQDQDSTRTEADHARQEVQDAQAQLQKEVAAHAAESTALTNRLASAEAAAKANQVNEATVSALTVELDKSTAALAAALSPKASPESAVAQAPSPAGVPIQVAQSTAAPGASSARPIAPATRSYVVVQNDSLSKIALKFYGSASKWPGIYEANKSVISSTGALSVGMTLRIP